MRRDKWPVVGPDDCIYCHQAPGTEHAGDCVMRKRTVVVEARIKLVTRVPEVWSKGDIEFHFNDSSWCANNLICDFEMLKEYRPCLCDTTDIRLMREASPFDEEGFGVKVNDVPEEKEQVEH